MNEASAIERRRGTAAVVTLFSLLMGCGGATAVGAPAAESQPLATGPELPDRVQRQHRRRMEECLALAAAPVTAPSLDYPDYLLDGLDLERAPRPAAQLEREIAHTSTLLSRAGDDREEREGALVALARFERELSRHREGEEALTLRRQELEHLEAFVSAFPESSLVAFAQLSMGRAKLALGDTEGAIAAFRATLAVPRVELHLAAAAHVNLARLAAQSGDVAAAREELHASAGLGRSTSRRLEWYRTARIFRSLGAYEAAWLARGAGDEAAALADFEHAISEPRNDEREPMATHFIAAIALEEMCAPWRPEAAADAATADTQPEPSHAHVRLLHATPASSAASVSLFVGDADEPIARDITFEAPASYAAAPALASELVVRGGEGTSPLAALSASPLRPHAAYTVILFGSGTARDPLVAELQEDVPVDSDQSRNTFRFFNAMAGSPALELCRVAGPRRTPLFSGATLGGYGVPHFRANATPVDPMSNAVEIVSNGVVELEVYPAGRTPCSGRKLGTARFSASSGLNGTIIAVGTYRTTRSRELFMCADAPSDTNCIEVPLDGR